METTNRYMALSLAVQKGGADVVADANAYLTFLDGSPAETGGASSPKATRQRNAAATATEPAGSTETETSAPAGAQSDSNSTGKDDMFGEDEKPAETKKSKTKKTEIKKEIKKTLDDVRAALVAAQTALKSKDKAIAILTEVAGAGVLSKLKEEDFGKLIDKCNAAVKAAA